MSIIVKKLIKPGVMVPKAITVSKVAAVDAGPKVVKLAEKPIDPTVDKPVDNSVVSPMVKPTIKKAAKAEFKTAVATTVTQHADGSEESSEEIIGGEMFEAPPANVEISLGLTRNKGNYESIKFSVSLSVPTANKPADIEEAFAFAKEWVDNKVNGINQEIDELVG